MKDLRSNAFPEMNPFWELLRRALISIGRGIDCLGITYYDSLKGVLTSEEIGIIPEKQTNKFFFNSNSLVTSFLKKNWNISKYFFNCKEVASLQGNVVGVSSNLSKEISLAIAVLWLITKCKYDNTGIKTIMSRREFWEDVRIQATLFPDAKNNNFISSLAISIEEQYDFTVQEEKRIQEALKM